jgi:hypothetical protein
LLTARNVEYRVALKDHAAKPPQAKSNFS